MNKNQISIIIRNKNNTSTLQRAVDSVASQSVSQNRVEVVFVDDGSSDKSYVPILAGIHNLHIFNTAGIGAVNALNFALQHVNTEYYTILDADDELTNHGLKSMLDLFLTNSSAAAIYGNYLEIEDNHRKVVDTSKNILATIAGGIVFKTDLVMAEYGYDDSFFFPEYDLLLKLSVKYPIVHLPDVVYSYFRRPGSLTANKHMVSQGIRQLEKKYGKKLPIRNY